MLSIRGIFIKASLYCALRIIALSTLFLVSYTALACEPPKSITETPITITLSDAKINVMTIEAHEGHSNCKDDCCGEKCNCATGGCATLWTAVGTESMFHMATPQSIYIFLSPYFFTYSFVLLRPPILS